MPQILFPDFFVRSETIDFVVTFDGLNIALLDSRSGTERSVEMVPGVAFFSDIFTQLWAAKLHWARPRPRRERLIRILIGLLVIPLLLELVLVGRSGHGLRPLKRLLIQPDALS